MQLAQPFALSLSGRSEPRWSYELVAGGPAVYCLLAPRPPEVSQAVLPTKSAELRVRACVRVACVLRAYCVLVACLLPPSWSLEPPPPRGGNSPTVYEGRSAGKDRPNLRAQPLPF